MQHTISVLVENEFGVLVRVAGLFSGRGFNIESLTVAETLDPTVSRITLVTRGDDRVVEQIEKQLNKLICVIEVSDFANSPHVEREMALIKVKADEETRAEVISIVDIFRGKIIDVGPTSYIVEMTGAEEKIQAMVERTAKGGGELVNLLGTSAWYAPGAAAAQMVDAIMLDEKRVLPCTVYLEGEYGIDGLYMGVPARLGAGGVEDVVKLKLSADERRWLKESAAAVREVVGVLKRK